jgi:two-component system response regulator FlrC
VLATTNRQIRAEVQAGRFREDLYYRLCVFPLAITPLRERRDDILPLAMQLLASRCQPGSRIPALDADAAHLLLTYPWPGNVRELDNLLQRALILVNGPVIRPEHVQFEIGNEGSADPAEPPGPGSLANSLANSLDQTERDRILDAQRTGQGNRREAAERLGISPRTLRYKLARLREAGIDVPAA